MSSSDLADLREARAQGLLLVVAGEDDADVGRGRGQRSGGRRRDRVDHAVHVVAVEPRVQGQAQQRAPPRARSRAAAAPRRPARARTATSAAARSGRWRTMPAAAQARHGSASRRPRRGGAGRRGGRWSRGRAGRRAGARRARAAQSREAARGSARAIARAPRLDRGQLVELRVEDGGQDVGEHVAAALGHPGVLVHLAAQERAAVGALLADDLRARAPTSGSRRASAPPSPQVTFFVSWKLKQPASPRVPSGAPAVGRGQALGGVLDHLQARGRGRGRAGASMSGAMPGVVDGQEGRRARRDPARRRRRGSRPSVSLLDVREHRAARPRAGWRWRWRRR